MKMIKGIILIFCMLLVLSSVVSARSFIVHNASNESDYYFVVNGTSGNVGIGTANPNVKLDILNKTLFNPDVTDGANAVAYTLGTSNTLDDVGSRWLSVVDNGTEVFALGKQIGYGYGSNLEIHLPQAWNVFHSDGRLDFDAPGQSIYFTADRTIFQSALRTSRIGDASSTATQEDAYPLVMQNSLWNGSSSNLIYSNIRSIASTSENLASRLAFRLNGASSVGDDGDEYLSILSSGRVGIGTTSPNARLEVNGSNSSQASFSVINSTGSGKFFINATSGNVGIGTGAPGAKLEVAGNTIVGAHDGSDKLYVSRYGSAQEVAYIVAGDTDRNVDVGLSFQYRNDVGGVMTGFKLQGDGDLNLVGNRIINTGNVGIGTSSPNATLDVNGNISVNSSILSPTGTLTLGGTGGTYDGYWSMDYEEEYSCVKITAGKSVNAFVSTQFLTTLQVVDDVGFGFGNSADVTFMWETTGNDNLQIGTGVGSSDYSGYFSFMEKADMGTTNRSPTSTSADPVFRVYSSDATEANDYIETYHDQADAFIVSGNGKITLDPESEVIDIKPNGAFAISWENDMTYDQSVMGVADAVGNQLIITNRVLHEKDHDHPVQTDPTLFIHSDTDPDTNNSQYL
ncbi:hypothetical protein KAJ38_02060, partial [Candidatus Pacearchaeota archaeon]|nr:hypothetical protein [Candidatus Pacearchaeota archaeon]